MDESLGTEDILRKLITCTIPELLAVLPGHPSMLRHVKALLAAVQMGFPSPESAVPSISQFFNFTDIKIEDVDCSDGDLAEYKSFVQTAGEVGERTTLTDYLIAKSFQPVVQQRYAADLTIAQMVQLRVDLKHAKRFVGYVAYHLLFKMMERKADQIKTGDVDANSILDDILLIIENSGPIIAKSSGLNEEAMDPFKHGLKMALTKLRDGIHSIMKAYQDNIYKMELEEKYIADKPSKSLWDLIFEKNLRGTRVEVAAQLEFIEALDRAILSLR